MRLGAQSVSSHQNVETLRLHCVFVVISFRPLLCAPLSVFIGFTLLRLAHLLFNERDQCFDATTEFLWRSTFDEPVKAELPVLTNLGLELIPVPKANLRNGAQQETIFLFSERFELVRTIRQLQFAPRVLVHGDLFAHRLEHIRLTLNLLLTLFNVSNDALVIGNLLVSLPEHRAIIFDFLERFTFNIAGNLFNVVATMLFTCAAKRLEITAGPLRETLREQRIHLSLLFIRNSRGCVSVVLGRDCSWNRFQGGIFLLLGLVPIIRLASDILVVNFLNSWLVVELEVLHLLQLRDLRTRLGRTCGLRHGVAIVLSLVVILLTLTLRRIDPIATDDGLHVDALRKHHILLVIFIFKLVERLFSTHRELNRLFSETLHLAIECLGFFFTASHDCVDIFVGNSRR
mmetsp:Transcript_5734/g.12759  ORF Transcript_5734/g.12759 Transcript_5734/m.12759 type:complete len:402 (+) Transcript_5734:73-1278(+)